MANPPSDDGALEFHIRATGSGHLSDILVHHTAAGDVVRLGSARGSLTLAPASGRDVLLVAGGTGLAPIRSLLGEQARLPSQPVTWLFFGARSHADLYDLDLLISCAQRWPWLRLVPAVSDEPAPPLGSRAAEIGTVVDMVARRGDWAGFDAYVSGPRTMVSAMRHVLPSLGVPTDQIRYDLQ